MTDFTKVMVIEDAFRIKARGVVVTGRIDCKKFYVTDAVFVFEGNKLLKKGLPLSMELFMKNVDAVMEGDAVGILLPSNWQDVIPKLRGAVLYR